MGRPTTEAPKPTTAIGAARLLPAAVLGAWERSFVGFACDEINGLFDRISALADGDPCPPALKARLWPVLEALSWDREVAVRIARQIASEEPDRPEDVFAPAMILISLRGDDEETTAWTATLPPRVRRALAAARC